MSMIFNYKKQRAGFTLIEIMFTVALITFLSSLVLAYVQVARARAQDVKMVAEAKTASDGIYRYFLDNNRMPPTYICDGTCVPGSRNLLGPALEDTSNPNDPQTESGRSYNATMQALVTAGYISAVPHSPTPNGYSYMDYGQGSVQGVAFKVTLNNQNTSSGSPTNSPNNCSIPSSCTAQQGQQGQAAAGQALEQLDPHRYRIYDCQLRYTAYDCQYYLANDGTADYDPNGGNPQCPQTFPCAGNAAYCSCTRY
jgi:prepilin-type N-terminal cleavage/methylation domain-containing protein